MHSKILSSISAATLEALEPVCCDCCSPMPPCCCRGWACEAVCSWTGMIGLISKGQMDLARCEAAGDWVSAEDRKT
jgi:hypothetical protein